MKTKIQWADYTFNAWRGCTKVSPGCRFCYAEKGAKRNPGVMGKWGPGGTRVVASERYWREPEKWNAAARNARRRGRVFALSYGDWLEDREELHAPRARLLDTVRRTPNLDWLLLTKRPENWTALMAGAEDEATRAYLAAKASGGDAKGWKATARMIAEWRAGVPPRNVWAGASVEDQATAEARLPALALIPAVLRFVSAEPLLGPVNLQPLGTGEAYGGAVHWVICGGESGPHSRPFDLAWATLLASQCRGSGVAFFMKQVGENGILGANAARVAAPEAMPPNWTNFPPPGNAKRQAAQRDSPGCLHVLTPADKKGGDPADWPEALRVREVPPSPAAGAFL